MLRNYFEKFRWTWVWRDQLLYTKVCAPRTVDHVMVLEFVHDYATTYSDLSVIIQGSTFGVVILEVPK
jgi:hypothetical protein